ncbi:MAG: hypothetical protein HY738_18470 [Bacteroidia bacterium]|nr:hypothetical protein [Bacteroidia bacterium]
MRETFLVNQLQYVTEISLHQKTDFYIDKKYAIEVGGKDKNKKQISGLKNAYIASDNIEYGFENKIPLWFFGFLY